MKMCGQPFIRYIKDCLSIVNDCFSNDMTK